MEVQIGSLLKIDLSSNEALYFKVVKSELTAVGIKQICTFRRGILKRYPSDLPCSYIYKSELGVRYYPVEDDEKSWLREMYKKST
ncbi:hypothetical protein KJ966_01670 [bacterium]|nr:hypothetical protein [bacterium]